MSGADDRTRVMAIDPGTARCGVAVSDPLGMIATPAAPIRVGDGSRLAETIAERAAEVGAGRVLIGHPLNMDGTEGPRAAASARLAERVRAAAPGLAVDLVDERLTTVEAEARLVEAGRRRGDLKALKDSAAAAVLLQWWLDGAPGR
ncbi:MAG: Holliday junction resolvase RuvX [Deltaproteobacteria bacterium]|nr:Holliday junction resolvase RuvX [Deltaproteobacteria bacterium]